MSLLYIGILPGDGIPGFSGYIDDFRFYTRQVTATEINTLYNTI